MAPRITLTRKRSDESPDEREDDRRVPLHPGSRPAGRAPGALGDDPVRRARGGGVHQLPPPGVPAEREARLLRGDRGPLLAPHGALDPAGARGRARGLRHEQGDHPLPAGRSPPRGARPQAGEGPHRGDRYLPGRVRKKKEPLPMTTTEATLSRDETQIRTLVADQLDAIRAKDLDRLMAFYAADAVLFDVKPPFQTDGAAAWRRTWEACLPYFPSGFQVQTRGLHVAVGGELAFAHYLWRVTGREEGHPAMQTWYRSTTNYRKIRGKWQIVHEHGSVPFDPMTSRAAFTLEP